MILTDKSMGNIVSCNESIVVCHNNVYFGVTINKIRGDLEFTVFIISLVENKYEITNYYVLLRATQDLSQERLVTERNTVHQVFTTCNFTTF